MPRKVCSKCEDEKDLSEFYKAENYSQGVRPECIKCRRDYLNQLEKERRSTDKAYRLRKDLSSQLRKALVGSKLYKQKARICKIVGLDNPSLVNHLHSTFEENYGIPREHIDLTEVQIDHITPISTAKTEEEVMKLNHYSNLQLLFKDDNQAKGTD